MTEKLKIQSQYKAVDWPAPTNVHALVTTRKNGFSENNFDSFNLAEHVGDDNSKVDRNRSCLQNIVGNNVQLFWLQQIHSNRCVQLKGESDDVIADASFCEVPNKACVVMTADCLPILFSNRAGDWVAASHAGWRGLADGVVQNTVAQFHGPTNELIAWIGPAISQEYFEVGGEVRDIFVQLDPKYQIFFKQNQQRRFQFDFIGLAKYMLNQLNIECFGGKFCSYADKDEFYSYRRDGETGRMASVIWFE